MKLYIAGPISGTEDYVERFDSAAKRLKRNGFEVENPTDGEIGGAACTYEMLMLIGLGRLASCDGIYLLNGWEKSLGANREYGFALARGMLVMKEGEAFVK